MKFFCKSLIRDRVKGDAVKSTMVIPQLMLDFISLWPERRGGFTKLLFWIQLSLLVLLETGQVIYFLMNIKDITIMAGVMSTISTTFQAICKMSVIFFNHNKIQRMLDFVWHDFWPSASINPNMEAALRADSKLITNNMLVMLCFANIFAIGFLTDPMRSSQKRLPYDSWYPFDWKTAPVYQLLYLLQCCLNQLVIISVCGHDNLFLVICTNSVAQFKMLKGCFQEIGTGDAGDINKKLLGMKVSSRVYDSEEELFVTCIQHHVKLIRMCNELEATFKLSTFVQLACSTTAICVSTFLITSMNFQEAISQIVYLSSYCLGHILQLFIFCATANELGYQRESLALYMYNNNWYKERCSSLRKDLIMTIRFTQERKDVSSLIGIKLNYTTFIAVLRLSFSFFTFLTTIGQEN